MLENNWFFTSVIYLLFLTENADCPKAVLLNSSEQSALTDAPVSLQHYLHIIDTNCLSDGSTSSSKVIRADTPQFLSLVNA